MAPMSRPQPRTPWKASAARSTTSPWSTSNGSERSTLPSSRKTTSQVGHQVVEKGQVRLSFKAMDWLGEARFSKQWDLLCDLRLWGFRAL